ncbi:hypothetical protein [Catenulispora rubra]|nr:hypothetical protein [Catenulispora rubra]
MKIEVVDVRKRYGHVVAVAGLMFSVERPERLGKVHHHENDPGPGRP